MQMPELATKLQAVGLSEKQAKVYIASAFLGPSAVQKIASQAGINRATAYVILDELSQIGLVNETTLAKKTVFVAEPSTAIDKYLAHQNQMITAKQLELKKLLPDLQQIARTTESSTAPVVRFYKDKDGIAQAQAEILRKTQAKAEVYSVTNIDELEKLIEGGLEQLAVAKRKKQLFSKDFYFSDTKELTSSTKLLRHTKQLLYPNHAELTLYPETVNIVTYSGNEITGVVIESKQIAQTLRLIFELAWDGYRTNQ